MFRKITWIFAITLVFLLLIPMISATPNGIVITPVSNTTDTPSNAGIINTTGGSIATINVNGSTQNTRWKAFVGNVTGKLKLDDANNNTIYDWSLSTMTGEVYATRHFSTINWSGINCALVNHTEFENINLSHTSPDDNITATFNGLDNKQMVVGTTVIAANTCRTANLYQNSTDTASTQDVFEEVVLHDLGNSSISMIDQNNFGNIVYAQNLENNVLGFDNQSTYDFQLIVPEIGLESWASSTAYYFYMELS